MRELRSPSLASQFSCSCCLLFYCTWLSLFFGKSHHALTSTPPGSHFSLLLGARTFSFLSLETPSKRSSRKTAPLAFCVPAVTSCLVLRDQNAVVRGAPIREVLSGNLKRHATCTPFHQHCAVQRKLEAAPAYQEREQTACPRKKKKKVWTGGSRRRLALLLSANTVPILS